MPWFPEFASAVELARRQTRTAGRADPVGQYVTALNTGDTHVLETVWPGKVVVFDPHAAVGQVPGGGVVGVAAFAAMVVVGAGTG